MENIKIKPNLSSPELLNPELIENLAKDAQDSVMDNIGKPVIKTEYHYNPVTDEDVVVKTDKLVNARNDLKTEYNPSISKN
jgi:hypothetical protein